jgi:hypothetical protein
MSNYFSYFPKTNEDLEKNGFTQQVTNILRRFKVRETVKDNADVYYDYDIRAGERPDTIAEKYYGSGDYAWVVLHFNDIIDPVFGWPLFNNDFDEYIKRKYGSISEAQATVHEWRRVVTEKKTKSDGTIIPEKIVYIDEVAANELAQASAQSVVSDNGTLSSITVKKKGSYEKTSAVPSVTISAPETKTATALSNIATTGIVTSITVSDTGSGYTSTPNVTVSDPEQLGGTVATATAVMDDSGTRVASISITNSGTGYENPPTITIAAPVQGTTATATASFEDYINQETGEVLYKRIGRITITNAGTGYSYAPTVTIADETETGVDLRPTAFSYSKYDWEVEQNDAKRRIRILDKRYLNQIAGEVEDIIRNGV